jgi:hypothetical protein
MKKRFRQFFVSGVFLILILTSFVSAGFFGNLWNKITGESVKIADREIYIENPADLAEGEIYIKNPVDYSGNGILVSDHYYDNYDNYAGKYCEKVQNCSGYRDVVVVDDMVKACRCDDYWGCDGESCVRDVSTTSLWERVGSVVCTGCEVEELCQKYPGYVYKEFVKSCVGSAVYEFDPRFDEDGQGAVLTRVALEEFFKMVGPDFEELPYVKSIKNSRLSDAVVSVEILGDSNTYIFHVNYQKVISSDCISSDGGECFTVEEEISCIDSDAGKDSFNAGFVNYGNQTFTDVCEDSNYVREWYCLWEKPNDVSIRCENGCEEGACLEETNETEENETEYFGNYSYCVGNLCTLFVGDELTVGNYSFSIGDIAGNFVNLTVNNLMTNDSAYFTGPIPLRGPKGLDERRYIVLVNSWYYGEDSDQNFIQFEFFISNLEQGESYCSSNYCKLYESDRALFDAGNFTFDMGVRYDEELDFYDIYPHYVESGYLDNETALSFYSEDWYSAGPFFFTTTHVHGGETHNLTTFFFDEQTPFVFTVDEVHATHDIFGNAIAQGESYISFNYSYNGESKKRVTISQGTTGEIKSSDRSIDNESLNSFSENINRELSCDSGCLIENNCVPVCYRAEGKYCSFEGKMVEQVLAGENCDNNCECSSNLCVDGECVSGSLWQKILAWFNRFSR